MKLAVIITGGTILSAEQSGFLAPSDSRKNQLVGLIGSEAEFEVINPYTILSEQLDGSYLSTLIKSVGGALNSGFDGIIVLHGTDTLQYSAAALHLAFSGCATPVILVSSNYILDDPRSNGRDNLHYAIEFIRLGIGGVFVSYKNTGSKPVIHIGGDLLPHSAYSGDLYSLGGCYGYFEGDCFIREKALSDNFEALGEYELSQISPVLYLKAVAGFNPPALLSGCKAVLIETYHSGTLPTENEKFRDFCKGAYVPVYAVGVPDETRYASTACYNELGLRILPPLSPVFAYIQLWQRYSS